MTRSDRKPGSDLEPCGMGKGAEPGRAAPEPSGRTGGEPRITIVVAASHTIIRHGLVALLRETSEFQIVGEARSGQEAVELSERLRPDVLIVGLMMPGLNGLEVARRVHQPHGITHVVVLST